MKKAYLNDLQSRLLGTVTDNADARAYFATDGSIFSVMPEAVVYPRNTADVRKTLAFAADRTESGRPLAVTARGKGTDQSGGALGAGLHLVFPAHMNRILKLDRDSVTVQPGLGYRTLQQTLHTHGRFMPPYPSSIDYSTIGGAVANNAGGEKSLKYGDTRRYVESLKVVLADGSLIQTGRLTPRQLARKQGQSDLEGEIYRSVDRLIDENAAIIHRGKPATTKNASGYELAGVKRVDGSFDLTPLVVGSQGTLGVISEITLRTAPWNPRTTLVAAFLPDLASLGTVVEKLLKLKPSAIELVDRYLLEFLRQHRPQELDGLLPDELPGVVLLVEFDEFSQLTQGVKSRRAVRVITKAGGQARVATDAIEQEALWKIRHSAAAVIWMDNGTSKALPFIEDGIVPPAQLPALLDGIYQLLARYGLDIAVWGHAGDGNLHLQPFLDLARKRDVETLFALAADYRALILQLGGSLSGEHNDGLVRGAYLPEQFGDALYGVFAQVKDAFDPYGILGPGVKIGVTEQAMRASLRSEYSMKHLYDHLPRT